MDAGEQHVVEVALLSIFHGPGNRRERECGVKPDPQQHRDRPQRVEVVSPVDRGLNGLTRTCPRPRARTRTRARARARALGLRCLLPRIRIGDGVK